MKKNFYCKIYSNGGYVTKYKYNGKKTVSVDTCKEQCFECMADVGERILKTKSILNKKLI